MKTLFALLTGAALGTAVALWLAARGVRDQVPETTPAPTEAVPLQSSNPEEASA